jgi:electron transfer flavoprotein alpha/beta subunit
MPTVPIEMGGAERLPRLGSGWACARGADRAIIVQIKQEASAHFATIAKAFSTAVAFGRREVSNRAIISFHLNVF